MNKIFAAVIAVLAIQGGVVAWRAPKPARVIDEGLGRVRTIVVHYVPSAEFVGDTYADYFRQLGDAEILLAVEKAEHAAEFERRFGRKVTPVVTGKPITTWSRDRFVAAEGVVVVPPAPHDGVEARRNDHAVPFNLGMPTRIAPFRFDGGDFCAIGGRVVATSTWAARNPERRPEDLVREAERLFGMPVVYIPNAPDHHVGMAFAPVGGNTVLVGDMNWGRRLAPEIAVNPDEAARFDAMAESFRKAGFVVHRIPALVTDQDYAWITYTNGIHEDGIVFMPVFGIDALDRAAAEVYRNLGYGVRPVRVANTWRRGGTLHCLVHVVRRG